MNVDEEGMGASTTANGGGEANELAEAACKASIVDCLDERNQKHNYLRTNWFRSVISFLYSPLRSDNFF